MKFILLFIIFPIIAYSQDCKTLNQINSFKGIKFGQTLPQPLIKYFRKSGQFYFLKNDINLDPPKSYHDFNGFYFENMSLDLFDDSIVYSAAIWSTLDAVDSQQIEDHQPLLKYANLVREITELFGDSTYTEEKYDNYSSLFGAEFKTVWKCDKTKIELTVTYGSTTIEVNSIEIVFTSIELEKKKKLQQLTK
ncbi:MAG: hypothetical protein ABI921_11330 [Panacibacter sp.]